MHTHHHPGEAPDTGQPRRSAERTAERTAEPAPRLAAAVRRSAVDSVSRSPGQPLATPLKEEEMQAGPFDALRGPGAPLDPRTRDLMETRLGTDFSHVRVHTDERAAASACAVNALAYTVGNSIAFGPGRYAPQKDEGFRLLAHELVHTVQQGRRGLPFSGQRLSVESPRSPAEDEARMIGAAVAPRGVSGAPLLRGLAGDRRRSASPPRTVLPVAPGMQAAVGNQAPAGGLQRAFVKPTSSVGTRHVLKPDEVREALGDENLKKLTSERLLGPKPEDPEKDPIKYALKKLAEGPDIVYDTDEDLLGEIEKRLDAIAPRRSVDEAAGKRRRKLNRLAGQLEQKLERLRATKTRAKDLVVPFGTVVTMASAPAGERQDKALLEQCGSCVDSLKGLLTKDSKAMWVGYDAVSTFGPLGHVIVEEAGEAEKPQLSKLHQKNLEDLREIRQLMAIRPGVTVIAHRGSGPTNRTMGGLIQQDDQRRLNRPAENSPEAFQAALDEVTKPETPEHQLDGIECDVFLSGDGVPMLSHEGRIKEQLNKAMQEAMQDKHGLSERDEVRNFTAQEIMKFQRTKSAESRFMTLAQLLEMVRPFAVSYFEATGYPLRVEIEMKGTKEDENFPRKGTQSPLSKAVAKVVSQEIKQADGRAVEYILFNGTPEDRPIFSGLRTTKTALGGLYTGTAPKEEIPKENVRELEELKLLADELRYQFTAVLPQRDQLGKPKPDKEARDKLKGLLKEFIVTLVYGQEFAPRVREHDSPELKQLKARLQESEPSSEIVLGRADNTVKKALARRREGGQDTEELIETWLKEFGKGGGTMDRLHILTDFPAKASLLKEALGPAAGQEPVPDQPGPSEIQPEGPPEVLHSAVEEVREGQPKARRHRNRKKR